MFAGGGGRSGIKSYTTSTDICISTFFAGLSVKFIRSKGRRVSILIDLVLCILLKYYFSTHQYSALTPSCEK